MTTIRLHDTKTRRKVEFAPIDPKDVRLYVCGPTVYDRAHLGNARPVLVFDLLYRLLREVYGPDHVTYARNFTDVDDKINARAAQTGRPIREITDETILWYHQDMDALGALRPDHEPRATDYVGQMVAMIERLALAGHAYAAEGHVMFSVASYEQYGALSGRDVEDMIAGARVEVAPYKRDPMDFVLWKPSGEGEPGWDGPVIEGESVGHGRPGWHIECSAMSYQLFGASFDIHGGGIDLQFPHHENEIAQSACAHPEGDFANIWMHNEMLQVEGRKMSKSLGNFFTVRDLLERGVPGEVIRLVMLGTHYRKPMDWTEEKRAEAEATLRRWYRIAATAQNGGNVYVGVLNALGDDLNSAGAIAEIHQLALAEDASTLRASLQFMGFMEDRIPAWATTPEVDLSSWVSKVTTARSKAMENKDFAEVDRLKAVLKEAGVEVRMSKAGVELVPGPGFDAAKLEGQA
ncbi:cysteine--tRNA ligase [Limimaricola cinnabarinus]|jgi:cysteinyl-tRNA synthetase|uniref:Cysteine--tRNA ligase n=1 Tax=Limimaricola cinnabarinus TaxID=1125964 RepID=A0A2G1MKI7_9RHOB|nr:cysteine--tRNA ligase [Limimaricola cinnabarinus]PHP29207.1 cysteine--tRNA ligase [Limimaricola cinnabarinus]